MEERILKILFGKSGSGSISSRISLPMLWIKDMGLSEENRQVKVKYNKDKKEIIIKNLNINEKDLKQLESNNQKIIEKLEKKIKQITSNPEYDFVGTEWRESWVVEELQEILEMLKK